MLSVVLPTPLKVNAVSEDDTKKLYIIGVIASYAGINIDLDAVVERFPNFLDDVMDLAQDIYDDLADEYSWNDPEPESGHSGSGVHRDENNVVVFTKNLENYLDSLSLGLLPYNPVAQMVNYKFILCVVRAIAEWCENNLGGGSSSGGANDAFGTVSVADNTIDFYTAGSISLTLPDYDPNDYNIVHFYLNSCTIDFHINIPDAREYALWGYSDVSGYSEDPHINAHDIVITPNDCDLFAMIRSSFNSPSMSGKTLPNYASSSSHFNIIFSGFYDICIFDVDNTVFIANGHRYYIVPYNDGYSFVNLYDDSIVYNSNLVFDTKFDAAKWFWNLCGIDITPSQPSIYSASGSSSPVSVDNSTVNQTISTVTNYINNDNSTTSMIFPSYYTTNNYYNYSDFRQHPEYIFDFDQQGLYNSSFDLPAYDGNKWATKFPFCIPFDIIHLFSGFSALAEAPEFHFIVLPENSFGLQNDEFSIDVDFEDFNVIVQLLRFFIAVGFLLWLMVITNHLIQH